MNPKTILAVLLGVLFLTACTSDSESETEIETQRYRGSEEVVNSFREKRNVFYEFHKSREVERQDFKTDLRVAYEACSDFDSGTSADDHLAKLAITAESTFVWAKKKDFWMVAFAVETLCPEHRQTWIESETAGLLEWLERF